MVKKAWPWANGQLSWDELGSRLALSGQEETGEEAQYVLVSLEVQAKGLGFEILAESPLGVKPLSPG